MPSKRLSTARKALMWWFEWPGNPHVSLTVAFDFTGARRFLERLNAEEGAPSVTVSHLAAGIIARVLVDFPEANARIIGHRIEQVPHVGIAMPVDLMGQKDARRETGMALVEELEALSLRGVADRCRRAVTREREGRGVNLFVKLLTELIDRAPYPLLAGALGLLDWSTRSDLGARLVYRQLPFTTGLTNAGAPFKGESGILFRGVSMVIPQRLFHVPTIWGLSAVQDEVLAIDGKPEVRPVLPVVLVFDHRLFDGVMAGRIMLRFGEILRDPEATFGVDGERTINHYAGHAPATIDELASLLASDGGARESRDAE